MPEKEAGRLKMTLAASRKRIASGSGLTLAGN
jgi:hypothetical protein